MISINLSKVANFLREMNHIAFVIVFVSFVHINAEVVPADDAVEQSAKYKLCDEEKVIDHLNFEAIKMLHKSMDDDSSGSVDVAESLEFAREELHITERDRLDKRKKIFHHNSDSIITVDDLWCRWVHSEERKWTTDQMVEWLEQSIELPQYKGSLVSHRLTGSMLPRISLQSSNFLFTILGISNPVHRQKIQLKAMDVVLFGHRSTKTSFWKDVILLSLLCIAVGGYWFAVTQRSAAQQEAIRLSSQMDKLKDIEQEFVVLQEKFKEEKSKKELTAKHSEVDIFDKEEQIEQLKNQLLNAEKLWEKRNPVLIKLLRKTYDSEMQRINQQKQSSLRKMAEARDMVEKFKKKRSSLFSQIRSVHIEDMESIDQQIMVLKQRLEETAYAIEECQQRWSQIESLSGFSIVLPSNTAGNHVPNHVAGFVRSATSHGSSEPFEDSTTDSDRLSGSGFSIGQESSRSKCKSSSQLGEPSGDTKNDSRPDKKESYPICHNGSSGELYKRRQPGQCHKISSKQAYTKSTSASNLLDLPFYVENNALKPVEQKISNSSSLVTPPLPAQNFNENCRTPESPPTISFAAENRLLPAYLIRSQTQWSFDGGSLQQAASQLNHSHKSTPFLVNKDGSNSSQSSLSSKGKTLSKFRLFKKKKQEN